MDGAGVHGEINKVVSNVEPRRARVADIVEIGLTAVEGARVHGSAFSEKDQLIEERNNVRSRLVNGKDNGPVVVLDQGSETFDDVERIVCIQPAGGFVQE